MIRRPPQRLGVSAEVLATTAQRRLVYDDDLAARRRGLHWTIIWIAGG
jgi:hypothetical protein